MSVVEVPLPSPPPESHLPRHMSGLFSKFEHDLASGNGGTEPSASDLEAIACKRVEFHPWTTNILEPQLSTPDSEIAPSLRSLPASRDCQSNLRPILKARFPPEGVAGLDGSDEQQSPLQAMDSLLTNLLADDRTASVDAYQTITNFIKTYDDPPESDMLQKKMTQLQTHIKRDIVVLDGDIETLPSEERLSRSNLVMSALKVLVTMIWSPVYSPCLTEQFRTWAIDRSIHVLKEHTASKAVLLHYMHLLATQTFRKTILTNNNRAVRILEVLQELTDHVTGKAVVAERLLVYQKLMDQAKDVMEKKVDLWLKNLLTAMGHGFKEVRSNAISAGTKACMTFSNVPAIAACARQCLAEVTGERNLSTSITNRLERVLAAKDEANQIPQIWTIVLMLCNGRSGKLEAWSQLHDWLKLIQRCFNSSDMTVRVQALMAWNRLYFVARPYEASDKVVSLLAKPAMVQLDKTGNNQSGKGTRQAVVSSYCMLIYYAFKPSLSHTQYARMWNEFVVKLMTSSFLAKSLANCDLSCRVLASLFHGSPPYSRIWNESRAHENKPVDPVELPTLDCKWVRAHISDILKVVRVLVEHSSFGPNPTISDQAYIVQMWRHLMLAIRESCSKEITASSETKSALEAILRFLDPEPAYLHIPLGRTNARSRILMLTKVAVEELGPAAILQGLEHVESSRATVIIQDLVMHTQHADSVANNVVKKNVLDRALNWANDMLKSLVERKQTINDTEAAEIIGELATVIALYKDSEPTTCLMTLHESLIQIVQALDYQPKLLANSVSLRAAYTGLWQVTLDLLEGTSPSDYSQRDSLAQAFTGSADVIIQAELERRHARPLWCNELPVHDSPAFATTAPSVVNPPAIAESDDKSPVSRSTTKSSFLARMRPQQPQKPRPRHDDSQVDFVSVESSPPDYDKFESQLLTARQKDVRERQATEPAITFADIRSSPSSKRPKSRGSDTTRDVKMSPEIHETPTLPRRSGGQDDETDVPTPTPKARKQFGQQLQPEIPSSPPSVVGGDSREGFNPAITSSPVKETNEEDGAVQLGPEAEILNNTRNADGHDALGYSGGSYGREGSPELAMPDVPAVEVQSTHEEYETAVVDPSSPFSDEFDALAASQLSQNLADESYSAHASDEELPKLSATKRKRSDEDRIQEKPKRRKSTRSLTTQQESQQPTDVLQVEHEETFDLIVVNRSSSPAPLSSKIDQYTSQQANMEYSSGPVSPASSQRSQKSIASTALSQDSRGKKRKYNTRSRQKTKQQASQNASREASPETQIRANKNDEPDYVEAAANVSEMAEELTQRPLISLPSEVQETIETDVGDLTTVGPEADVEIGALQRNQSAPTSPIEDSAAPLEVVTEPTPEVRNYPQEIDVPSGNASFDAVKGLQSVLDNLSTGSLQPVDLAVIHSLCFQIGLKAQQLAQ